MSVLFFQTVDEEFNREEKKFVNLEKAVRTLVRNISTYLEQVQVKIPKTMRIHCAPKKFEGCMLQKEFQFTRFNFRLTRAQRLVHRTRTQHLVHKAPTCGPQGPNFWSTRPQPVVHKAPTSGPQGPNLWSTRCQLLGPQGPNLWSTRPQPLVHKAGPQEPNCEKKFKCP